MKHEERFRDLVKHLLKEHRIAAEHVIRAVKSRSLDITPTEIEFLVINHAVLHVSEELDHEHPAPWDSWMVDWPNKGELDE